MDMFFSFLFLVESAFVLYTSIIYILYLYNLVSINNNNNSNSNNNI